jgi:hypothetical protein
MRTLTRMPISIALLLAFGAVTTGCYKEIGIRPSELPKLNGGFVGTATEAQGKNVVVASVSHVEGEDGRMFEVEGEHDVIVTLKDGRKVRFNHPTSVAHDDGAYTFRGGNRPPEVFGEQEIQRTDVTQVDRTKSLLIVLPACVIGALLIGVVATNLP